MIVVIVPEFDWDDLPRLDELDAIELWDAWRAAFPKKTRADFECEWHERMRRERYRYLN